MRYLFISEYKGAFFLGPFNISNNNVTFYGPCDYYTMKSIYLIQSSILLECIINVLGGLH